MSSQNRNLETSYLLLYAHVYSPDIGSSQCAAAVIILKPVLRLHDQVKLIHQVLFHLWTKVCQKSNKYAVGY